MGRVIAFFIVFVIIFTCYGCNDVGVSNVSLTPSSNSTESRDDVSGVAAGLYAGNVGLQQTGSAPIKVNINNVLNNPIDEFVTCGPAPGVISDYCRSIPLNGYGKIYATQLPNGFYQLADGHHRVAALRSLGKKTIKIFLTK